MALSLFVTRRSLGSSRAWRSGRPRRCTVENFTGITYRTLRSRWAGWA